MKIKKITTRNKNIHQNLQAEAILAANLLKGTGISILDAARLIKNALDFKPSSTKLSPIQFCTKIIGTGTKHLHIKEMSIENGFVEYLASKKDLRPASLRDIKYLGKRLFATFPKFAKLNFSELTLSDCQKWLSDTFDTAPQFNKAHRFLNAFFNYALRQEWADRNVVKLVPKRKVIESEIQALTLDETKALLKTSQLPKYQSCQAAVALQVWAGIRPQELQRLTWQDIDLDENIITIRPTTSKTGGSRHIEIPKPLKACLSKLVDNGQLTVDNENILPTSWQSKWKSLRQDAGFATWTQDVLRHTYASYHAKHFQDLPRLQLNMGHTNLDLLRTRYINLHNVTKDDAKLYFSNIN